MSFLLFEGVRFLEITGRDGHRGKKLVECVILVRGNVQDITLN